MFQRGPNISENYGPVFQVLWGSTYCYSHNGYPQSNLIQQPRIIFPELWADWCQLAIVSISDPNIVVGEKNTSFIIINDDDDDKMYD